MTTYYVSPDGNNANDGSASSPWLTIQHAVDTVAAYDRVIVAAGVYNEQVRITSKSQIALHGLAGAIIDPSTEITGWIAATEVGDEVYKAPIAFDPGHITIDERRVGRVHADQGGKTVLATSEATQWDGDPWGAQDYWIGVEAAAAYESSYLYLRIVGDTPTTHEIRATTNLGALRDAQYPAVRFSGSDNITLSGFTIRGAHHLIALLSTCHHCVIRDCTFRCGIYSIGIYQESYSNTVYGNSFDAYRYAGSDGGAFDNPDGYPLSTRYLTRGRVYTWWKTTVGNGSSHHSSVRMVDAGAGNKVINNAFNGGSEGILCDYEAVTSETIIAHNTIRNHDSCGVAVDTGNHNLLIYNNRFLNNRQHIRLGQLGNTISTSEAVYFYNNLCWQPLDYGMHLNFQWVVSAGEDRPEFYVYHNDFHGGHAAINDTGLGIGHLGLPDFYFVNNISSGAHFSHQVADEDFAVGEVDYNYFGGDEAVGETAISWWGANNTNDDDGEFWTATELESEAFTDVQTSRPTGKAIDAYPGMDSTAHSAGYMTEGVEDDVLNCLCGS